MKKLAIMMTAVLVFALGAVWVVANQDAQSTAGATGQYSAPAANTIASEGGNVTENSVESNASTSKWQGFWGNVSGSLALGDGVNTFYDWAGVTFQAIYASPNSAPDWGGLVAVTSAADKEAKDTAYSIGGGIDDINSTMAGSGCDAGTEISSAAGVTPNGAGAWETCIADDTTAAGINRAVFGTNIASGTSYGGDPIDYQIMVPTQAAGTDYYFFLEI